MDTKPKQNLVNLALRVSPTTARKTHRAAKKLELPATALVEAILSKRIAQLVEDEEVTTAARRIAAKRRARPNNRRPAG